MMTKRIDLTGQKFGEWTVIEYVGDSKWKCKCSCGTEKNVDGYDLRKERLNRADVKILKI